MLGEMLSRVGKALSSALTDEGMVTISVAGIAGIDPTDDGDQTGERGDGPQFGPLGDFSRPLEPDADGYMEPLFLRQADDDEAIVYAVRDTRLGKVFPAAHEGTIARAHYGGGFWSFDLTAGSTGDQKGSLYTLYVPYQFSGGVPAKAHALTVDAEQETIMLTHGDGWFVLLSPDGITMACDASTWLKMAPGEFSVFASKISLSGVVALGANTTSAAPLLPGPASQPTPSVYFSPV